MHHGETALPTTDHAAGQLVVAEVVAPPVRPEHTPPPTTVVQLDPAVARLLDSRLAVIAILSVAGPIGLPALWLSRRFSRPTKIITTILFVLVTVVFPLAMVYYWCEMALRPLVDAFAGAGV